MASDIKLKITIAKLIELSIDENKSVAMKIVRSKGNFRVTVDQDGNAKLTGKAGIIAFNGNPVLEELGAAVKYISISFGGNDNGTVKYTGSFKVGFATLVVSGSFDIEKLVLGCSGILCVAARALKDRSRVLRDRELQGIMQ
ncbi:MAG: hypothetical protein GXP18_12860 [Gammaproteobacteria bacterium]|nr:hypothetical protein [Gammaproteobacteria bacterium]